MSCSSDSTRADRKPCDAWTEVKVIAGLRSGLNSRIGVCGRSVLYAASGSLSVGPMEKTQQQNRSGKNRGRDGRRWSPLVASRDVICGLRPMVYQPVPFHATYREGSIPFVPATVVASLGWRYGIELSLRWFVFGSMFLANRTAKIIDS